MENWPQVAVGVVVVKFGDEFLGSFVVAGFFEDDLEDFGHELVEAEPVDFVAKIGEVLFEDLWWGGGGD